MTPHDISTILSRLDELYEKLDDHTDRLDAIDTKVGETNGVEWCACRGDSDCAEADVMPWRDVAVKVAANYVVPVVLFFMSPGWRRRRY